MFTFECKITWYIMRVIIKKFHDILSNIGDIGSFILLIGVFINSFANSYIIILDTKDLIL